MIHIKKAVVCVGGVSAAARLCGVSSRAINKWIAAGKLPRTDFTGETRYAERLASGSNGGFTADALRDASVAAYRRSIDAQNDIEAGAGRSAPEVPVQLSSAGAVS